ncbi:hypothetical protein EYF80_055519 [Liparis tanakae]|uniref:Uncharacterized protein n=1 Tax=Liparis tanakae TaxID=230148 RepID=A0A4Z2EZD3_9TELE|nr:hypothetical protein EYF80_055519 [Liparis tanakae]
MPTQPMMALGQMLAGIVAVKREQAKTRYRRPVRGSSAGGRHLAADGVFLHRMTERMTRCGGVWLTGGRAGALLLKTSSPPGTLESK